MYSTKLIKIMRPASRHRLSRSAFPISLALLFWAAQILPALAYPAQCQMKSAVGRRSAAGHDGHDCCCGHADAHIGLKGRCCEVQRAGGSREPDFAVSVVPEPTSPEMIGLAADAGSGTDLTPFSGSMRTLDWVQSRSLSEPIYLNNLNFLC